MGGWYCWNFVIPGLQPIETRVKLGSQVNHCLHFGGFFFSVCELKSSYKWIMILNKLCDGMEVHMSPDSLCSEGCERPSVCDSSCLLFFPSSKCMAACVSVGETFRAAGADLGHLCSSACIMRPNWQCPIYDCLRPGWTVSDSTRLLSAASLFLRFST